MSASVSVGGLLGPFSLPLSLLNLQEPHSPSDHGMGGDHQVGKTGSKPLGIRTQEYFSRRNKKSVRFLKAEC